MNSKAYDKDGVVHMTPHKGAALPSCHVEPTVETEEVPMPNYVSMIFLSREEPITCMRCQMLEAEANNVQPDDDEDG